MELVIDDDILVLYIAMNDSVRVQIAHGRDDLPENAASHELVHRLPLPVDVLEEVHSFAVFLHHHLDVIVAGFVEHLEYFYDVDVVDFAQDGHFHGYCAVARVVYPAVVVDLRLEDVFGDDLRIENRICNSSFLDRSKIVYIYLELIDSASSELDKTGRTSSQNRYVFVFVRVSVVGIAECLVCFVELK